jgi:hypothetical protein
MPPEEKTSKMEFNANHNMRIIFKDVIDKLNSVLKKI